MESRFFTGEEPEKRIVEVDVVVRENSTGRVVKDDDSLYEYQYEKDGPWELSVYWWEEGGGSCDCNRALAFSRGIWTAEGNSRSSWDWPIDTMIPCSEGRFSVNVYRKEDGEELYREFELSQEEKEKLWNQMKRR